MSSGGKKKYILNTLAMGLGCGGGCRRSRNSSVFQPRPRERRPNTHRSHSHSHSHNQYTSSSSWDTTTTTFSSAVDTPPPCYSSETESDVKSLRGFGRIGGGSVAVEKDSDDPYVDFRQSMLQMILERQIYSKDDLKELLNCFLQLNSPYYHGIIVRAFTEIWNGVPLSGSGYEPGYPNLNNVMHSVWTSRDF